MATNIFSFFLFFFFAWLSRVWSARLAVDQVAEVPWMKAVALGTVVGSTLSRNSVGALQDKHLPRKSGVDLDDPDCDVFDRAQSALLAFIQGYQSGDAAYRLKDDSVVKRLIDDLRHSKGVDLKLVEMVDEGLRGQLGELPEVLGIKHPVTKKPTIQQIVFPEGEGKRGIVIGRYLSHFREIDHLHALQDMLRNMKLTNSHDDDLFLRCIAQSHTAEELAKDTNTEFMVMLEPFFGTIKEYLTANAVSHSNRMSLFVDAVTRVSQLYTLGIPHKSDINQDTVLVKGDVSNSITVVLSPNILSSQLIDSPTDSLASDLQQLGSLLRLMYNSSTWPDSERSAIDVILAFGKAMESGAMDDIPVLLKEIARMMDMVFSEHSTLGDLMKMRVEYLTFAVEAAQAGEVGARSAIAEHS